MERWDQLLELLGVHKDKLERYCTIITLQREIGTLSITTIALLQKLNTSEPGSHLLDVQEKLRKFQMQESQVHNPICHHYLKRFILQVNTMAESIKKVSKQSKTILNNQDLHKS